MPVASRASLGWGGHEDPAASRASGAACTGRGELSQDHLQEPPRHSGQKPGPGSEQLDRGAKGQHSYRGARGPQGCLSPPPSLSVSVSLPPISLPVCLSISVLICLSLAPFPLISVFLCEAFPDLASSESFLCPKCPSVTANTAVERGSDHVSPRCRAVVSGSRASCKKDSLPAKTPGTAPRGLRPRLTWSRTHHPVWTLARCPR